jgi:outer membrane protein assembly factor BamB
MRTTRAFVITAVLLLAGFAGQARAAAGDWPMDRHGPGHTGTNPDETALSPATVGGLQRRWQVSQCFVQTTPVTAGRSVYMDDSCGDTLYAISAGTGAIRWLATTAGFGGTPAVDLGRGLVFVSSQPNQLSDQPAGVEAFRTSDGHRVWVMPRRSAAVGVTIAGGRVFVPTTNGYVLALDEDSGQVAWRAHVGALVTEDLSVAHGRVVFLAWNGDAYALSQRTGAVVWRHHVTHGFREFSTPAIANGLVTFGTSHGQVMALDERTGAVVWRIRPATQEIVSAPAITGDTLVILTEDGRVLARDALTGARRWTRQLPADFLTSPAIANGVVYLADTQVSGSFWALALADGRTLLRRDDIHGFSAALSDPVIAHGALYIGEWDGESDTWLARYTL